MEYTQDVCDAAQVSRLCSRFAESGGWQPVAVFPGPPDAWVPAQPGDGSMAVLFCRPAI